MVTIAHDIDRLYQDTEESAKVIIEGSDDHLDLILSIVTPLNLLSGKLEHFNESFFDSIQNYSREQIEKDILPKLKQLNKASITLIGAIRTSFLYRDVREALKNYSRQYEVLREMIHDIIHLRIAQDDEFDALLSELNGM